MSICSKVSLFFILFLSVGTLSGADIQKWTDADGKVHYGERPPSSAEVSAAQGNISVVEGANASTSVSLYSTKSCGYCKKARAYMDKNNIQYREYDIEESNVANSRFEQMGGRAVPFLVMKGRTQQGYSQASYERFFAQYK